MGRASYTRFMLIDLLKTRILSEFDKAAKTSIRQGYASSFCVECNTNNDSLLFLSPVHEACPLRVSRLVIQDQFTNGLSPRSPFQRAYLKRLQPIRIAQAARDKHTEVRYQSSFRKHPALKDAGLVTLRESLVNEAQRKTTPTSCRVPRKKLTHTNSAT
jgi:hypothetical protein